MPLSRKLLVMTCGAILVAGCSSSDGGRSGEADYTASDGTQPEQPLPLPEKNPCDEITTAMECAYVANLDLNDDGKLDPVAIVAYDGPRIEVAAWVGGEMASYSPSDDAGPHVAPTGPSNSDLGLQLAGAFGGGFDVTGDGVPEFAVWTIRGGTHDEFRLVHFDNGRLVPLETPEAGMYSGGPHWAHDVIGGEPAFVCTEDATAPIAGRIASGTTVTETPYTWDETAQKHSKGAANPGVAPWSESMPLLGIGCKDVAVYSPEQQAQREAAYSAYCDLGRAASGITNSDAEAPLLEAVPAADNPPCGKMQDLWSEYQNAPKDTKQHGMALIVDFGDHTCSVGIGRDAVPGCTAADQSWQFKVQPRGGRHAS